MVNSNDKTAEASLAESRREVVKKEAAKTSAVRSEKQEAKELIQLVVFELDKEEYAVDISEVREILRMPEVTPIPNSPDFIEGIINVRGKIVVVIDMEERFNLTRESKKKSLHVVLAEIGESTFGAIVDEVTEVLRIPRDSIEAAPAIISEKIQADYVKGIAVLEDRLIIMLDFLKVFEEKGLAELGELVKKQAKIAASRQAEEKPEKEETEFERKAKVEKLVEERIKGKKESRKPRQVGALDKEEPAKEEKSPEEPEGEDKS